MHKGRFRLVLIVAVISVGVLVLSAFLNREPAYRGKKLSEWVGQMSIPGHPRARREFATDDEIAADAIRHIGTNALPYLQKWITYEPPLWKINFYAFVARIFHWSTNWRGKDLARARQALEACKAIGPEALPMLRECLNNSTNRPLPSVSLYGLYIQTFVTEAISQLEADLKTDPAAPQFRH